MNNAQLTGLRYLATDYAETNPKRLTISKTEAGWEVHRGGKLLGVTVTREGAKELAAAL